MYIRVSLGLVIHAQAAVLHLASHLMDYEFHALSYATIQHLPAAESACALHEQYAAVDPSVETLTSVQWV